MIWNTDQICRDLESILPKGTIVQKSIRPEGGHYTRDIEVYPAGTTKAHLPVNFVRVMGFVLKGDLSSIDAPKEDIQLIEIRDMESDSRGGLSQGASPNIKLIYRAIKDYFNEIPGVSTVMQLRDHF